MNIIVYLLSSLFMFFVGNMQEWLKPIIINHGAPSWVYNSFGFYAILFVAAGLFNTLMIRLLSPKTVDEKELRSLKRKCAKNEKVKATAIGKAVSEKEKEKKDEIDKLKKDYEKDKKTKEDSHKKEISILEAKIKAKDSFIESMTHQFAEKLIALDEYNKETNANRNKSRKEYDHRNETRNIVPDIGDYTT